MNKMRFSKSGSKKTKASKGFYIALGICLVAVGVAAWGTYDSVVDYLNPSSSSSSSVSSKPSSVPSSSEQQTGNPVSGISESSSEPSSSSNTSSEPTSSSSTPTSSSTVESQTPSSAADSEVETTDIEPSLIIYPVSKTVTKAFSGSELVYSQTMGDWRVHPGIDLAAETGSVVKSVTSGVVKEIVEDPQWGVTIVISHADGYEGHYCGLGSTAMVKVGDTVSTGQEIGSIKEVPVECAEESHLHFGLKKDGEWVDPAEYLDAE